MVSVNTYKNKDAAAWWQIRLLSTDTKPTEGVPNGSACIEIDTGKKYLFDATAGEWNEIDSSILIDATGVDF